MRPPRWLSTTGLALDDSGFIAVHPTLQSKSHANIFAAGDVATISGSPRPRAGVFAVRAGPVLAKNLRKYLHGHALKRWSAQRRYLAIIGTADNGAIASWGQFGVKADGFLALKYWIDRRFMAKYQQLSMPTPPAPQPFAGLDSVLSGLMVIHLSITATLFLRQCAVLVAPPRPAIPFWQMRLKMRLVWLSQMGLTQP